jgi:23S rRNA (guanosine2251-2'-O)-methyltransferase
MREKREYRERPMQDDGSMIYGTRAVIEAIRSGKEIERLFIQQGLNNPLIHELKDELKQSGILYQPVPIEKLNRLTRNNHQGVVGVVSVVSYSQTSVLVPSIFEKGEVPLLLILDRVTDTRNFGAIARTAVCTGVHGIIIPSRGSALIGADAIKTSAGALSHIPICREDNLKHTIEYLQESGIAVVACTEKSNSFLFDGDFKRPIAIIMGSEENGVSPEYLKRADAAYKIPMIGSIASFNVSVSAGMILYEAIRQRTKSK